MASDETPVERRLRLPHDNKAAFDFIEPDEDAQAIDSVRRDPHGRFWQGVALKAAADAAIQRAQGRG